MHRLALITPLVLLFGPLVSAQEPEQFVIHQGVGDSVANAQQTEFMQMLLVIMKKGAMMDGDDGWFKPSRSRYGWKWLAAQFDADKNGKITRKEFGGPDDLFARLDRDRDGTLAETDFDWSESSPYWRQFSQANMWLRQVGDNGKLSREQWLKLFDKYSQKKDYLTVDDVRAMLNPPRPPSGGMGKMPSKAILLKGLATGELGSASEGPRLGRRAPDFTLSTHDGRRTITLSKFKYQKPVVLIFGSFT
jgi:hypothetical protein